MYSTIRDIIVNAEQNFGSEEAIRYKVKKDEKFFIFNIFRVFIYVKQLVC